MFIEGNSQSAIARIMGKNFNTVHSYIYRESKKANKIMELRIDKIKREEAKEISFDEMWTYERARKGSKRKSKWIWTACIELKDGRKKYIYEVGNRNEETFLKSA